MMTRTLATFALVLTAFVSACDDDGPVDFDMSAPAPDTTLSTCFALSQCVNVCDDDAGTKCRDACLQRATPGAKDELDALVTCVQNACAGPGLSSADGGTGPCEDPSSLDCMRCRTNAEFTAPASCPDGAVGCGVCYEQARSCIKPAF